MTREKPKSVQSKLENKIPENKPLVGILMGSASDAGQMEGARKILSEFGVACEFKVLSAHRTPDETLRYVETAYDRGIQVIIAGAGGAAHLAGIAAANTTLPVIGVPLKSNALDGIDSLLSTMQMPTGVPVATVAIDGATNAGILALRILGIKYPEIRKKLSDYREKLRRKVLNSKV